MADMTTGNPLKLIIRFTIPLLLGNIVSQLYSLIDTVIVGRTLGLGALGAIGAVTGLVAFVQGFILGVASGLSLILAQRFGTRNDERIHSSFVASIWISLAFVAVLTAASMGVADFILKAINIPEAFYADGHRYFITVMLGLAVLMYYSILVNALRSMGSTTQLLFFITLSQVLNIAFDFLFILVIPMGVMGVAVATILSQFISGLLCQLYLMKKVAVFRLNRHDFKLDKREIKLHLNISLPIGIQSSIISIGSIILQLKLNGLGTMAVEGHAIGAKIESMTTMPLVSFGVATATYAAQNYGAGQIDRIWQGVKTSTIISLTYSLLVGGSLFFFGKHLAVALFNAENGDSLAYVDRYFKATALFYLVLSILFVFRYTLQGMGKSIAPTIAGFMEMIMRIVIPLSLTGLLGFQAIIFSHPMAWIGSTAALVYALWLVKRNDRSSKFKRFMTS